MFDFDKKLNRLYTNSVKWDGRKEYFGRENVIPLWVADTDFSLMPEIKDALLQRLERGNFGYATIPDEFYTSIVEWNKRRHHWTIDKTHIVASTSVLASFHLLLRLLTKENDKVLLLSPIYYPFKDHIENLNRIPVFCDLLMKEDVYRIDFEALEKTIQKYSPRVFVFCNPHNPSGRVWSLEEQTQLVSLLEKYNIEIISDEIHKDIIFSTTEYIPMEQATKSYKEHIYTITAPTKTFNLAGIKVSYAIIHNQKIRNEFIKQARFSGISALSTFAFDASIAAYTKGDDWVDALVSYLENNYRYMKQALHSTNFHCTHIESTFLIWINFSDYQISDEKMKDILIDAGLGVQMGYIFGEAGKQYIRLNIGTQKSNLEQAVKIFQNIHNFLKK